MTDVVDNEVPDPTNLVQINQYNIGKQNLEKKIGGIDKKIPGASDLVTANFITSPEFNKLTEENFQQG